MLRLQRKEALTGEGLRRLHRRCIEDPEQIRSLLDRARAARSELRNGVDRRSAPRLARVSWVTRDRMCLETENIDLVSARQLYFNFELDGVGYFFAIAVSGGGKRSTRVELRLPHALYELERRETPRDSGSGVRARRVELRVAAAAPIEARVYDESYQGLGISVPSKVAAALPRRFRVRFADGERAGTTLFATVRHRGVDPQREGWRLLGLSTSNVDGDDLLPVEDRASIRPGGTGRQVWRRLSLAGAIAQRASRKIAGSEAAGQPVSIEVAHFENDRGQALCALIDRALGGVGGTAVVIPPAWGRTKETTVALARTLVAGFEAEGESCSVIRFDGTNRRGESWIDPECRAAGDEYLHFRFSQAVQDIRAAVEYALDDPSVRAERVVVVSFSLGAIEARRALALNSDPRVAGWVSVVGMVDLQSGLRTVSGGIDYAYGYPQGVRFGLHELVGVVADMDVTGADAWDHKMVFLEDARADMAQIQIPVAWIHGRHDAWMDLERVQRLLGAGDSSKRRLLVVPTGHQLRSSRQAIETFQLVTEEAVLMASGRTIEAPLPDLADLERRSVLERERLPAPELDKRRFWRDYLLGRDGRLGLELMTVTNAYQDLMRKQVRCLALEAGDHVVDLGSGTGDFPLALAETDPEFCGTITAMDLVPEALQRVRGRLRASSAATGRAAMRYVVVDVDRGGLPLRPASADAVLASLFLSYVERPADVLRSLLAALRPGGRLVVSSMRRDADISRIYVESLAQFPPDERRRIFGSLADDIDALQRAFVNDAARLLTFEEQGVFTFWEADELADLVRSAGFEDVALHAAFGDPPQAAIIAARKPERGAPAPQPPEPTDSRRD